MRARVTVVAFIAAVALASSPFAATLSGGVAEVMFDFGGGRVLWGQANPTDAWNATLGAAHSLGLVVNYSIYPSLGVFVNSIAGRTPRGMEYWHLAKWNSSALRWEATPGASSVSVAAEEAIGWFISEDVLKGGQYLPAQMPLATPAHPDPAGSFRYDAANSGEAPGSRCGPPGPCLPAPSHPTREWSFRVPGPGMTTAIDSTPAIASGVVYLETFAGLYALNATTGQRLWNTSSVRGLGSPALHNGNLTVGGVDGNLYYVSGADGRTLWQLHLVDHGRYKGLSSSPKVVGGRAYLGTYDEGGGPGEVVSVNLSNGTIAWRVPARGGSIDLSSPAVLNDTVYIGISGLITPQLTLAPPHGLLALNASDGSELWFHPTDSPVVSSPVVAGGRIYYTEKAGALVALTASDGSELWRRDIGGDATASPALGMGRLFVASGTFDGTGLVRAYDLNGMERWSFSEVNGGVQASPTYTRGVLYVSTNARAGTVYAIKADNGTLAWAYTPQPQEYLFSSPVVVEGRLYQGSDAGILFALSDVAPQSGLIPPISPNLVLGITLLGAGVVVAAVAYAAVGRGRRG